MSTPTPEQMIKVAAREIGYREGRNNSNKYGRYFGADGTAWCAQWVSWVAEQAGAERDELFPETAWYPDLLAFARKHDLIVIDPTKGDRSGRIYPGDIFLVQRSGQPNGAKHVGLVEKDLGDWRIQTIEGNTSNTGSAQGNGVYRLIRKMNTGLIVVFRPKYAKAPASGGGGTKPPTGMIVDLSQLIKAAKADPKAKQGAAPRPARSTTSRSSRPRSRPKVCSAARTPRTDRSDRSPSTPTPVGSGRRPAATTPARTRTESPAATHSSGSASAADSRWWRDHDLDQGVLEGPRRAGGQDVWPDVRCGCPTAGGAAAIGTTAGIEAVNWLGAVSVAALATILSVCTSIVNADFTAGQPTPRRAEIEIGNPTD